MKIIFKRVIAYLIDILLVSLISTIITTNSYINKDYKKYIEVYNEYQNVYETYERNIENLKESLDEEKIDEKQYKNELENLNSTFDEDNINYNYKLVRYSVIPTILSILVIILYFVVIQMFMGGKTLGKWLMKLKVVSNNNKKLNIINFLIRSLILNGIFINLMSVVCVLILSKNNYLIYNEIIYVINYILEMTIVFMIAFEKNSRGLHDYIANTKVIYEGDNL